MKRLLTTKGEDYSPFVFSSFRTSSRGHTFHNLVVSRPPVRWIAPRWRIFTDLPVAAHHSAAHATLTTVHSAAHTAAHAEAATAEEAVGLEISQQSVSLPLGNGAVSQGSFNGSLVGRGQAVLISFGIAQGMASQHQVSLFLRQVASSHCIGDSRAVGCVVSSRQLVLRDAQCFSQQSLEVDFAAAQETGKMQPETGGTAFLDGVSLSLGDQISSHSLFQCLIGSRLIGGFQLVYADSQRRSQTLVRNAGSNSNASALHHAEHAGSG